MHQKALAWDKTARFERRCLVFEIEAFSPKVRAMEMALRWCCAATGSTFLTSGIASPT